MPPPLRRQAPPGGGRPRQRRRRVARSAVRGALRRVHAAPRHAAPRNAASRRATQRHATPRRVAPRNATPRHAATRRFARCSPCRLPPPHTTARYRLRVAGELLLVAEWGNSRVSVFERESLRFLRHIGATLDEDGDPVRAARRRDGPKPKPEPEPEPEPEPAPEPIRWAAARRARWTSRATSRCTRARSSSPTRGAAGPDSSPWHQAIGRPWHRLALAQGGPCIGWPWHTALGWPWRRLASRGRGAFARAPGGPLGSRAQATAACAPRCRPGEPPRAALVLGPPPRAG